MKLPYTEVKFYPEVKSQTGLSSLRVSCKRALIFVPSTVCGESGSFTSILWGKNEIANSGVGSKRPSEKLREILGVLRVLINQFDIIYFCLTYALTGVHFRGDLNYIGHVG